MSIPNLTTASQRASAVEWAGVVKALEDALVLYRHQPGSLAGQHRHYLLSRTDGRISALSALLRQAAIEAIESGYERIDRKVLDGIPTDWSTQSTSTARKRTPARSRRAS